MNKNFEFKKKHKIKNKTPQKITQNPKKKSIKKNNI